MAAAAEIQGIWSNMGTEVGKTMAGALNVKPFDGLVGGASAAAEELSAAVGKISAGIGSFSGSSDQFVGGLKKMMTSTKATGTVSTKVASIMRDEWANVGKTMLKSGLMSARGAKISQLGFWGLIKAASITTNTMTSTVKSAVSMIDASKKLREILMKATPATKTSGLAMMQAGFQAKTFKASTEGLSRAKIMALAPTYALGAATKFLTGPWGLALSLLTMILPPLIDFGKKLFGAKESTEELGNETAGLNKELEDLSKIDDIEIGLGINDDIDFDLGVGGFDNIDLGMNASLDMDFESAEGSFKEFYDTSTEGLVEFLKLAKKSNGKYTDEVKEEYEKRTQEAVKQIESRRTAEKKAAMERAAEAGLSFNNYKKELDAIDARYDEEVKIMEDSSSAMMNVWENYVDGQGELTDEGWTKYKEANQAAYAFVAEQEAQAREARMEANTQAYTDMYDKQNAVAEAFYATANTLTAQGLQESVDTAERLYNDTVSAAKTAYDEKMAFAREDLAAGRINNEQYAQILTEKQELYNKNAQAAKETKDKVALVALEELANRNNQFNEVVRMNGEMEAENQRHSDRKSEIHRTYKEKEENVTGTYWEQYAKKLQLQTERDKELEEETRLHNENMNGLQQDQITKLGEVDDATLTTYTNILDTVKNSNLEIPPKAKELNGNIMKALEPLPKDMKVVGDDAAKGLIQGLEDRKDELRRVAKQLGEIITDAAKEGNNQASPSKDMMKVGDFAVEGLVIGLDKKTKELRKASRKIGEEIAKQTSLAYDTVMYGGQQAMARPESYDQSSVNHYNNQRSFSTTVNVQDGRSKIEWEKTMRSLMRKQAAAIAR